MSDKKTDFSKFAISQDFAATTPTTTLLMAVAVSKPAKMDVIRTHGTLRQNVYLLSMSDEETYLVRPDLANDPKLEGLIKTVELVTYITRKNVVKLWPIALPDHEGALHTYPQSARDIANLAVDKWLRVKTNRGVGVYEPIISEVEIPDPRWPVKEIDTLLDKAFAGKIIADENHPLLLEFLGRA